MNRTQIEITIYKSLSKFQSKYSHIKTLERGFNYTYYNKGKASKRLGNHPWATFCKLDPFLAFDAPCVKSG